MDEIVLLESASLRQKLCTEENVTVLELVGQLITLPENGWATTENVALFYQVPIDTIKKIVQRHRIEIQGDGYKVLTANSFREGHQVTLKAKSRQIAMFSRRAILRVGMLLTDSLVAKQVRSYLLQYEQQSTAMMTTSGRELVRLAEELQQHAIQINQNSEQLVGQAGLIKAIVGEINRHGDSINGINKRCDLFDQRIKSLEQSQPVLPEIEYISSSQIEILRAKVYQLGHPTTIWKRFNRYFEITRYRFLPREKFQEALDWLISQE